MPRAYEAGPDPGRRAWDVVASVQVAAVQNVADARRSRWRRSLGARAVEQLRDDPGAVGLHLPDEMIEALDAPTTRGRPTILTAARASTSGCPA